MESVSARSRARSNASTSKCAAEAVVAPAALELSRDGAVHRGLAMGRDGAALSPQAALSGRLTDGSLHRQSVLSVAMPTGEERPAAVAAVAAMVKEMSAKGTWAASFDQAAALQSAVSTSADAYTDFESALVEEVNRLRRDPAAYATLFEQEATLGYPFLNPADEFFGSDAAAAVARGFNLPALRALIPRTSVTRSSNGASTTAAAAAAAAAASAASSPTGRAKQRPISAELAAAECREESAVNVEEDEGAAGNDADADAAALPRATLGDGGVTDMNLAELRAHFARHQRHRAALECALGEVGSAWLAARQAQREAWAHDDEKASKRSRRSGTGGAKKKLSTQSGGVSGAAAQAAGQEELQTQRQSVAVAIDFAFARQLVAIHSELAQERDVCGRAVDGINLLLGCLRALRAAAPVPPVGARALLPSRGLVLAARRTGRDVYIGSAAGSSAATDDQRHQPALWTSSCAVGLGASLADLQLPPIEMLGAPASAARVVGVDEEAEDVLEKLGVDPAALREAADPAPLLLRLLDRAAPATAAASVGSRRSKADGLLQRLDAKPVALSAAVVALVTAARGACGAYGCVSGEVRGLQLYGVGNPRALVMRALLGVAVPAFRFSDGALAPCAEWLSPGLLLDATPGSDARPEASVSRRHSVAGARVPSESSAASTPRSCGDGETVGGASSNTAPARTPDAASTTAQYGLYLGGEWFSAAETSEGPVPAAAGAPSLPATTAATRAAQAAHRLGPLLWPGARVVGCGWLRPTGGPASADPLNPARAAPAVCTTILLASAYEELEVIHRLGDHTPLAELDRIVQEQAEVLRASSSAACAVKAALPAVLRLHSSTGAELLWPRTHPLQLTLPTSALAAPQLLPASAQCGSAVVIAVRADARTVDIQACVTAADALAPAVPTTDSSIILVQRSPLDVNVTLVFVHVRALAARLRQSAQAATMQEAALHLYERRKAASAGGGEAAPSGFGAIGLVRLTIDASAPSAGAGAAAGAAGTTAAAAAAVQTAMGPSALFTASGSAARAVTSLRGVNGATATAAMAPPLPDGEAARWAAHATAVDQGATADDSDCVSSGWPTVLQDFEDRCVSIVSPLRATLPVADGGSGGGRSDRVRVAVRLPSCASSLYLATQLAAARAQLVALSAVDAADMDAEAVEQRVRDSAAAGSATAATGAGGSVEETERAAAPAVAGAAADAAAAPAASVDAPPLPLQRGSAGPETAPNAALERADDAAPQAANGDGGGMGDGAGDDLQRLLIAPTQHYRALGYFDAAQLNSRALSAVGAIAAELGAVSARTQRMHRQAAEVLQAECTRVQAELERRKGREQLRLKHEVDDINQQLKEAAESVVELRAGALLARDVYLRRTRDRTLRQARLTTLRSELARLTALTASASGAATPPSVTLCLVDAAHAALLRADSGARLAAGDGSTCCIALSAVADGADTGSQPPLLPPQQRPCSTSSASADTLPQVDTPCTTEESGEAVRYAAEFTVPARLRGGQAVLLVDGADCVRWNLV